MPVCKNFIRRTMAVVKSEIRVVLSQISNSKPY